MVKDAVPIIRTLDPASLGFAREPRPDHVGVTSGIELVATLEGQEADKVAPVGVRAEVGAAIVEAEAEIGKPENRTRRRYRAQRGGPSLPVKYRPDLSSTRPYEPQA